MIESLLYGLFTICGTGGGLLILFVVLRSLFLYFSLLVELVADILGETWAYTFFTPSLKGMNKNDDKFDSFSMLLICL